MFDDLVGTEKMSLKKINNLYISLEQIEILEKYEFDVKKYNNFNELIFDIEEFLNNSPIEYKDLEWVSEMLSEFNYYQNTNK